jgi:hypothetical protein
MDNVKVAHQDYYYEPINNFEPRESVGTFMYVYVRDEIKRIKAIIYLEKLT